MGKETKELADFSKMALVFIAGLSIGRCALLGWERRRQKAARSELRRYCDVSQRLLETACVGDPEFRSCLRSF